MADALGLGIKITAEDMASGTLRGIGRESNNLKGNFQSLGAAAVKIFGGIATAAGSVKAAMAFTEPFAQFEKGLTAVSNIAIGGQENLAGLREAAIQAGIATQFSPKEAVDGLLDLSTAGQTAQQAIKTLNPVLDLASASMGQLGVSDAATAVVGTLNSFNMGAEQSAEVTDKLTRITQLSNFQMRDFGSGLAKAAAAGGKFGQSLDGTLVTLGLLRNRNIDASSSATAYREALRRLGSDKAAMKATEKYADVFDKTTGKMRPLNDIMLDFAENTAKLSEKDRNLASAAAFGARGMLAFGAVADATFTTIRDGQEVTLKGRDAIEAMSFELEASKGAAGKFRDAMLDTLDGQQTLLKGTMETLQIVGAEGLAKVLKPVVAGVTDAGNQMIQYIKGMAPETKDAIGQILAGFLAFTVVGGILLAVSGALSILGIAALPVAAVLFAIGFALKDVITGSDDASVTIAKFGAIVDNVKMQLKALWEGFQEGFESHMPTIKRAFGELQDALGEVGVESGTAKTMGQNLGDVIGKLAVYMIRGAVAVTKLVNAVTPFGEKVVWLVDKLGGLDKLLIVIGSYQLATMTIGFFQAGAAALAAAGGTGIFTTALTLLRSGNIMGAIVSIGSGLMSAGGAALAAAAPVLALTAAFAALALAVQQAMSLMTDLEDFGDGDMDKGISRLTTEFKHDVGLMSDAEYQAQFEKDQGIVTGSNYDAVQFQGPSLPPGVSAPGTTPTTAATAPGGIPMADPTDPNAITQQMMELRKTAEAQMANAAQAVPPVPTPASQVDVASQMSGLKDALTAAAVAAAKAQPPPITKATLNVDGQQLADIVAQHSADGDNGAGVPVGINAG